MKKAWILSLATVLVILASPLICAQSVKNLKGQDPPSLTVSSWLNTDKPITLDEVKGQKVILLEFFMLKCPHCIDALPQIKRLHENYAEDGLLVISITNDPADKVKEFLEERGLKNPVAIDSNYKTTLAYGVQGVPWSFLIGASGKVIWQGDPRAADDIQIQSELIDLKKPPK